MPAPGIPAQEKRRVALTSLLAATFLAATKLTVGVLSGSLGIISEAAHSTLDLVAAAITYISVRAADVPADESHPFGHGKVEHLSAFIQTGLLILTSGWIVVEAYRRLFLADVHVEPSPWAFAVLFTSIIIDTARARALFRAARKYQSQALEANALHFSTDVYSTVAVFLGLVLLAGAQHGYPEWLRHADPVAALVVAGVTLYVGLRLGRETVGALLDAAPAGVSDRIAAAVSRVPGVLHHERTRVRQSGNQLFIDLRIVLESNIPFEHAEAVVDAVETQVHRLYPTADVVVDASPGHPRSEDLLEKIRSIANRDNFQIHDVVALTIGGHVHVDLDLEVDASLSLQVAHDQATQLEHALRHALPEVEDINVHIEPRLRGVTRARKATRARASMERRLLGIVRSAPGVLDCHALEAHDVDHDLLVTVHCTLQSGLSVTQVHNITEELELRLRAAFPRITRVNIHPEPQLGPE
jgi:cation diffusion facilitator family transporter